jgi:hypothetical protein
MGNLLYAAAIILLIAWAIGLFGNQSGSIIHILIIIAFVALRLRVNQGRRAF